MQTVVKHQPEGDIIQALSECLPHLDGYAEVCMNKRQQEHTIKRCKKQSETFKRVLRQTSHRLNPPHSLGMQLLYRKTTLSKSLDQNGLAAPEFSTLVTYAIWPEITRSSASAVLLELQIGEHLHELIVNVCCDCQD